MWTCGMLSSSVIFDDESRDDSSHQNHHASMAGNSSPLAARTCESPLPPLAPRQRLLQNKNALCV